MKKHTSDRPEVIEGAPLLYAPQNELGVVFLFSHLAKKWRLRIEEIKSSYPDCIAYQKIRGKEKRIRIEFEYKSKNFKGHRHDPNKCDWIVCWEHNWPDAPQNIEIKELRREFGLGFNVWIVPMREHYQKELDNSSDWFWSVPSQAHKGDLILFYSPHPHKYISNIYVIKERVKKTDAGWKEGKDYMTRISKVCILKSPIFFEDLKIHKILSTAHFVRGRMQGRPNATEYWPYLYDMIIRRNSSEKKKLFKFAPENLELINAEK